jgi:CarD family transcriptional regulator
MATAISSLESSFNVGDHVVYAKHGVGVVEDIEEMEFRGENYYSFAIFLKATGVKLFVPVDEAEDMGLRPLEEEKTLDLALEILSAEEDVEELAKTKTWKERKKVLDDLFKSGKPEELAKIVRYLYCKNQVKDLPNSERKVYDFALKFLLHEIAEVKGLSEEEADNLIAEALI